MPVWSRRRQSGTIAGTSPPSSHIRFCPGFIYKNQSCRVKFWELGQPLGAPQFDIFTLLFVGMERFFYTDIPAGLMPGERP